MSWLSDSTELIAGGWFSSAYPGHGVRGDAVPSSGDSGPAPLYNDITLPADAAAEVRALILTLPSAGTFAMAEDSSFTFGGAPDGTYTATYQAYKDGVAIGGVNTITLTVGAAGLAGAAADTASASGALTTAIRLAGDAIAQALAGGGLSTQIPLAGGAIAQALTTGTLTTQIKLAGVALDQAGASGTLTVGISGFSGAALAQAAAGGELTTGIRLTGASLAVATAGGDLGVVTLPLAGSAVSLAAAGGILTAQIRLAGAAVAQATAVGTLAGTLLLTKDSRYTVRTARRFAVSRVSHARPL